MDILTNRSTKQYDYTSRYATAYTYYNSEDDKYMYGLTKQLSTSTPYVLHSVKQYDSLDSLANTYYGRPDLFWIIADFNRIQDPFIKLFDNYKTIKIPTFSELTYKES